MTTVLSPFDSRTLDFRNSPVNTCVNLLVAVGWRCEGDIAFNPDSGNVNAIGLNETYQTVLRRGRNENRGESVYNRLPPNFTGGEGQIA